MEKRDGPSFRLFSGKIVRSGSFSKEEDNICVVCLFRALSLFCFSTFDKGEEEEERIFLSDERPMRGGGGGGE